jgi:thiaminase
MNKSTKIVLGLGAVAILIGGIQDVMNRETSGLRRAHQAAGWEAKQAEHTVECETLKEGHDTWALCRYWRATPTVWLKQGDDWAAANGPALMMIDMVESIDTTNESRPYQNFARLYRDSSPHPMTSAVQARMNELRAKTIDDRR